MGSEAKTTSDHLPETPSPIVSELISELKTCFSKLDFQNVAKILMNREQDLFNKTHFLENEKDEILKENKKLNDLLKKKDAKIESLKKEKDVKIESLLKEKDAKIESLEKENKKLNDLSKKKDVKIESLEKENKKLNDLSKKKDAKIESLEKENEGLKDEVKKKQNEIGVYEKKVLDLNGRVLSLEKLSKELLGSGNHSVDLEVKNPKNVVGEGGRPPPPPGFEEILDPKPKKERDSKVPEIIEIDDDDDDDDDDDHGDRDLMKVSSKRKRDEIKRDDSDDDKCISFLRRKKVSNEVTKDHKKDNYDGKIPTRTPHLKSPFCDSSSSDSDNEITKMSAKISLPKDRWETREDMVKEFAKNDQLCLNAICALHKQDASQKHVVLVRPFDAYRISSLSRKKTLSELSSFDLHQCRQFAMDYSDKLFDIYKEKSDTFFPAL